MDGIVSAVTRQVVDITAEQVKMVLEARERVVGGDPVGTVLEEAGTGKVAVRVSDAGALSWRIVGLDGSVGADMQGTLPGWAVLRSV